MQNILLFHFLSRNVCKAQELSADEQVTTEIGRYISTFIIIIMNEKLTEDVQSLTSDLKVISVMRRGTVLCPTPPSNFTMILLTVISNWNEL